MKVVLLMTLAAVACAHPEAPSSRYRYGAAQVLPQLAAPSTTYTYSTLTAGYNDSPPPPGPAVIPVFNSLPTTGGYDYSPPQATYQEPHVHKHIYVHLAPEEPEEFAPRQAAPLPPPQRHYKIVFIKAPTPPTPTAASVQLPQRDEEKTLIYVLVKKPDDQPQVRISAPAPTAPSKPEVYFIKYKPQSSAGSEILSPNDDAVIDARQPDTSYGPPSVTSRPSTAYGAP